MAHDRLEKLQTRLGDYFVTVRECAIPRSAFEPMLHGVLRLRRPDGLKPNTRESADWEALEQHLHELSGRYADELGENAYGVLNAITDFASRPPANRHVHRDRHSLQRLAGTWLSEFSQTCQRPDFNVARYVDGLAGSSTTEKVARA